MADDLRLRWLECSYFNLSFNPIAVARGLLKVHTSLGPLAAYAGYPPWSYVLGQFLVFPWLPYPVAKAFFLVVQILSVAVLMAYAKLFNFGAFNKSSGFVIALAGIASLHLSIVLRHGNYGLLVTALLALTCLCANDNRYRLAGLCFGFSLVKPQLSILFIIPLFFKDKLKSVLLGLVLLFGAWAIASIQLAEAPWVLVSQLLATSTGPAVEWFTLGLFDFAKTLGFDTRQLILASFIFVVVSSITCFKYRALSLPILWSVPAVSLALAGPYRNHDLVVLAFLVFPLVSACIRLRSGLLVFATTTVMASLWIPHLTRFDQSILLVSAYRLVWIIGLFVMLDAELRAARNGPTVIVNVAD